MKNIFLCSFFLLLISTIYGQENNNTAESLASEEVEVIYELNSQSDLKEGMKLKETINTSLNFGTQSKFERRCLQLLKEQAADKGYSVLYIDKQASGSKRFNKRGIEVTLVGIGFK